MIKKQKAPRWTIAFLRGLERTGQVRAAAEDAGIDHSTAYVRRQTHAEFREAWDEALRTHAAAKARAEEEEIDAVRRDPSSILPTPGGPPKDELGEELVGSGGQMKRVGHDRWSKRKEKLFFEELAATANVRRAAKAAGVSRNAVFTRRLKDRLFRTKWEAVAQTAKASIDMYLVEASNKTFDPDAFDTGDVTPKVTVAEAIRIIQTRGSKAQPEAVQSWEEEADAMSAEEVEELRERLFRKIRRLCERDRREKLEAGWTYDEGFDQIVPPGWVRPRGRMNGPFSSVSRAGFSRKTAASSDT